MHIGDKTNFRETSKSKEHTRIQRVRLSLLRFLGWPKRALPPALEGGSLASLAPLQFCEGVRPEKGLLPLALSSPVNT